MATSENSGRFDCLKSEEKEKEKPQTNGFKKENTFKKESRFTFDNDKKETYNIFREDRREQRTNWKGRGDINSFSRKYTGSYKEKEKEKKKIYEYKEDDFPSL